MVSRLRLKGSGLLVSACIISLVSVDASAITFHTHLTLGPTIITPRGVSKRDPLRLLWRYRTNLELFDPTTVTGPWCAAMFLEQGFRRQIVYLEHFFLCPFAHIETGLLGAQSCYTGR